MNAIEIIKAQVQPRKLLEHYNFKHIKETNYEIRCCCAIHGGNNPNAFVWNKNRNLWFCFTGDCGGGDVFDLIMKIEECSFNEAVHKASEIFNININGMSIDDVETRYQREQIQWLERMMKQVQPEHDVTFFYEYEEDKSIPFSRFDEFTLETFSAKKCKECTVNENTFNSKLVIPIYKNNKLISIGMRSLNESLPKWIYQPKGVKLHDTFYNIDNVIKMIDNGINEIVLTEGIFDVYAFWESGIDNVVAVFGSNISDIQYKILMKLNVCITLCFDNDDAGNKCKKQAIDLFKNKSEIKEIILPDGCDPDDIPRTELRLCYERRKKVSI